jgi:hypothetical protein
MKGFVLLLCLLAFSQASQELQDFGPDDVLKFVKGFMEGLNEQGDINKLISCLNGAEGVINDIIDALELIKTRKTDKIIQGISKLVGAVRQLIEMFRPCSEGFVQIKKLMQALGNVNFQKLLVKVLTSLDKIISLVTNCVNAFRNKNFHDAGKYLGTLLLTLFLTDSPAVEFEVDKFFAVFAAFFHELNADHNIENIDACLGHLPPIIGSIKSIINSLDWSDLKAIIKSLNELFDIIENLMFAVTPCLSVGKDFKTLGETFRKNLANIMNRLLINFATIIGTITIFINNIASGEYEEAAKEIGSLIYTIFLKNDKPNFID